MQSLVEILRRARAGEPGAQDELCRQCCEPVRALVHRQLQQRLRPRQHALLRALSTGDVVQEVLIEVLRGLDRWDGDSGPAFVALLATLVEHRLVDQVRRSQAGCRDVRRLGEQGPVTAGVADPAETPLEAAVQNEQVEAYRRALAGFSDRERALLALRLEDGAGFAELAARLAYPSADAARKAFHAVQARLLLALRRLGVRPAGPATEA